MNSLRHQFVFSFAVGMICCGNSLVAEEVRNVKHVTAVERVERVERNKKSPSVAERNRSARIRSKSPVVSDVALDKQGILHGAVVDAQGVPEVGVVVRVLSGKREVIQLKTDKMGRFAASGLRAGVYQVLAEEGNSTCRLWAPNSAPPSATDGVLVVSRRDLLRAQYSPANIFASDRFLLGTTIVGAAAVPVAIYGNRGSGS